MITLLIAARRGAVAWPRQNAMRLMIDAGYSTTQIEPFSSVTHDGY